MNSHIDMQNIIEYIEKHLHTELNIDKLSEKAMLSKFYFQRLFYKLVGVTVMEYVKLRRVAKAAENIKNGEKITDVAFNYGFNSLETFIRAFKSIYEMTPTQYRKSNIPLAHFYKPDLSLKYRIADIAVPLIAAGIVLEMSIKEITEEIKIAGVIQECSMAPAGQDNPAVAWDRFFTIKKNISNIRPGVQFGISFPSKNKGKFNYLAAAQVEEFTESHHNLYQYTIPAGLYAVCTFSAENFHNLTNDALDKAFNYFLQTWLPNSDYQMISNFAAEYYDYRCLKDHPIPQQVLTAPNEIIKNPPEMDIIALVKKK